MTFNRALTFNRAFTIQWVIALTTSVILIAGSSRLSAQDKSGAADFAMQLKPILMALSGRLDQCAFEISIEAPVNEVRHRISALVEKFDANSFDLEIVHAEYPIIIRRRLAGTTLILPKHKVAFVGRGASDPQDNLVPSAFSEKLASTHSTLAGYVPLFTSGDPNTVSRLLWTLVETRYDSAENVWRFGNKGTAKLVDQETGPKVELAVEQISVVASLRARSEPEPFDQLVNLDLIDVPRDELERQLSRGVCRAIEIFAPSAELTAPDMRTRETANGSLRWIDGQRLVLLHGSPEEIGSAHGELLREEAQRCIDSVLYAFGTIQTVVNGRWFRHDLDKAYARLKPHIPTDHIVEAHAVARSLSLDPKLIETINVFPELFHCSGFAVFGAATLDGKLYHGRVLDYMTTIGLQDCATTFIVSVDGKIPFANIGYAGFIGSVSGMNAQRISLGEMGGHGDGQWDGVPMATLMRRALEECSTLSVVKKMWSESPRTCEYYYVMADGKDRSAVGVAATPQTIEFVLPGAAHELLGEGIVDAVIMSAGDRLATLRQRVQSHYGKIDADKAQWLMSRPVAMESNLHNVLFVPEDGVFYVANASHHLPAADRPYVKYHLAELLNDSAIPRIPQSVETFQLRSTGSR